MKIVRAIFVTLCLTSISCSKKESDFLETLQIIGEWKLESMTFGGITSMNVECCDFIEFATDDIPGDSVGFFKASGLGYENFGTFEVSEANDSLVFKWDSKQRVVAFEINNDLLTLLYLEDSIPVEEDWRKQ
ncbi:MAG: hypothetical protein EBZ30_08085 [Flavobacteriia bacterium]|nr:hypothetical protein [Flavobacteriia bacterium]NDD80882.1 hypothetical protein [Flavobacteriia bacterium]